MKSRNIATALFALTTLVSAFLLFQVQPLLSKRLLPWFGGGPAVWTTCVLFFQTVLFLGYAYAHVSEHWLSRRLQAIVHIGLLTTAIALLPVLPSDAWKPVDSSHPTSQILFVLSATVGLSYFLLSSTGPLVSAWFSRALPGRSPYRLYALSNFGSLLALVTYPFVFEPAFSIAQQAQYWIWGFCSFALLSALSAITVLVANQSNSLAGTSGDAARVALGNDPPSRYHSVGWIALPAFASLAFLATTNFVCQDVAVVPFLWVAPLSLYLLSFIICFDHERWYRPRLFAGTLVALAAVGPLIYVFDPPYQFVYELILYFAGMFCTCMICHGELVRLRPPPRDLTSFYLSIAAGGALGGVFVSLIAPVIFSTYYEWPIAAMGSLFLAATILAGDEARSWFVEHRRMVISVAAVALIIVLSVARESVFGDQELVWQGRNFYGVVTVTESRGESDTRERLLRNGRITHGLQLTAPEKRRLPTSYYGPESGVGQTLAFFESRTDTRVGDVGLGAGTLATYARPGHVYRFYEINPNVISLAHEQFTFLADCLGEVQIVAGDARLSLERENGNHFNVLVLDAFSGDAIPTHLLTTEAFEIYERHLEADGALCIHVSNRYLDLTGVVRRLAERHRFEVVYVDQPEEENERESQGVYSSDWMVLSRNHALLVAIDKHVVELTDEDIDAPLWTDAHTDLFRILK